jgi:hypothetical protein
MCSQERKITSLFLKELRFGKRSGNLSNRVYFIFLKIDVVYHKSNGRKQYNIAPRSGMPKTDILMTTADFKSFETRQPDFGIEVLNLTDRRVSSKKGAATILTIKTKLFLPK